MDKKVRAFRFPSESFWAFLFSEIVDSYAGNERPIRTVLENIWGNYCKSVIVEEDYVDKDYQDEFSAFYSKSFKKYPSRCVRLHFFGRGVSNKDLQRFSLPHKAYLGFMIVRPIDLQRLGRTVLTPHVGEVKHVFITCREEFCAHILGQRLTVKGMPFIQQDTQVGVCAQAALWMLARYMSRRLRLREYLPAEINQFAKSRNAWGRLLPAERGLDAGQMLDALQAMGFSAEFVEKKSFNKEEIDLDSLPAFRRKKKLARTAKLAEIAYRYIESGLPVIFLTKNHAVVGVGHSYDFHKRASVAIQRISSFYVNDDAVGPYQEMPIFRRKNDCRSFLDVEGILLVSPHEATLQGMDAESVAKTSLLYLLQEPNVLRQTKKMRPDLARLLRRLEYRTYLRPSVELQEQLLKCIREHPNAAVRKVAMRLIKLDYPKYVWITEISSATLLNHQEKEKRRCLGRIIVDSTAPRVTYGTIAMHFADVLVIHDRQKSFDADEAWEKTVFPGSTPFVHMFTSEASENN